jgi:hypothetical protein
MVFLHINESPNKIETFNKRLENGNRAFVLVYKDGCPPCMETHPEWKKLENVLEVDENVMVADINEKFLNKVNCFGPNKIEITHYPRMIYISDKGKHSEFYEGERTIDALVKWIRHTLKKKQTGGTRRTTTTTKTSRKRVRTRRRRYSKKKSPHTKKRR